MRRYLALVAMILCAAFAGAGELESALYTSVDALSQAYRTAHPELGMKAGLVILDFEEHSELARRHGLGKAVEAFVRDTVSRSLVYELVDRKRLDEVLKEMELALSGMVEGGQAIEAGRLAGVRAFLWGGIAESGDDFVISLGVTDAETGAVVATESFSIRKRVLVSVAEELAYSYVAPNGLGVSTHAFMPVYQLSDLFNKAAMFLADAGLSYRPNRHFMVSAGIMTAPVMTGEHYRVDEDIRILSVQPGLASAVDPWGLGGGGTDAAFSQWTAQFRATFLRLDAQYTINFSPSLNVGLAGGIFNALGNVRMFVDIGGDNSGLYYRQQLATNQDPLATGTYYQQPFIDAESVEYLFMDQFIPGLRAEIRPEFFITPRLALSARIGFMWMLPIPVREVYATNAKWWFYQDGKEPLAWKPTPGYVPATVADNLYYSEERASWVYYGWNPLLRPDGTYWAFDMSCVYAYVGLSFFF